MATRQRSLASIRRVCARSTGSRRATDHRCWLTVDHLWTVTVQQGQPLGRSDDPKEIYRRMLRHPKGRGGYYELPARPVIHYRPDESDDLLVDPRLLGILLGDGSLSREGIEFASADEEITAYCRETAAHYGCEVKRYPVRLGLDFAKSTASRIPPAGRPAQRAVTNSKTGFARSASWVTVPIVNSCRHAYKHGLTGGAASIAHRSV